MARSRKVCQNVDFSKREIRGKKTKQKTTTRSSGENTQKESITLSYSPAKRSNLKPLDQLLVAV